MGFAGKKCAQRKCHEFQIVGNKELLSLLHCNIGTFLLQYVDAADGIYMCRRNECPLRSLHALVFKCATVLNHLGRDPSHSNGSAMHALHFLFQNMVQSANKGNLVHLRNENFLGAFI